MTSKPSTHYDNLQVPRDATPETIRAAYKHLARKYHPDRNQNSVESHRLMQSLNASFEVLDDPRRRAAHDRWIEAQERSIFRPLRAWLHRIDEAFPCERAPRPFREREPARWGDLFSGWIAPACVIAFLAWGLYSIRHAESVRASAGLTLPTSQAPQTEVEPYRRPLTAPNGKPWPVHAMELTGMAVDCNDGRNEVAIDNTRNDTDVFAMLVRIDGESPTPVRHIYIPRHQSYQCRNVRQGGYEVWYEDLRTGATKHSEPFRLIETRTDAVAHYSVMQIILFKMSEGLGANQRVVSGAF